MQVIIESNGDLQEALVSFAEIANSNLPAQHWTLHVEKCLEVMLEREDRREPLLEPANHHFVPKKEELKLICLSCPLKRWLAS